MVMWKGFAFQNNSAYHFINAAVDLLINICLGIGYRLSSQAGGLCNPN